MSAKTSTQPGRRTPLSLTGAVTKSNPNKGINNAANGSPTTNTNKQDNKLQQQKSEQIVANITDIKDNPNKRQLSQTDKKQQQIDNKKSNEKTQNGVNSNKQSNDNKQQLKDKQQQNGNEGNKVNEKDNKEKPEKSDKLQEKSEKDDNKSKEDKKLEYKPENKKDEKKSKDIKEKEDCKEDKKESSTNNGAKTDQQQSIKGNDKKSKEENQIRNTDKKPEEKVVNVEVVEDQHSPKRTTPIPVTPKSNSKANKTSSLVNKTPIKATEKTPQKSTSTNTVKAISFTKREETTTIDDDIEMEPLSIESSPTKSSQPEDAANIKITPSATSTPGKLTLLKRISGDPKSDVQLAMQTGLSIERPRSFSQISGRRSIRQIPDYTSQFESNQYRESYRRINNELDITNSSMNVTVGSEAPNNSSFSFFGRGRKRDRTSPQQSQSAIGELRTDVDISPPKKARLDMHGFFSVVSSPLSLLRNRFSKTSLQSSTPVKLEQNLNNAEDVIDVQNVSGVSVHEEITKSDKEETEKNTSVDNSNDTTLAEEVKEKKLTADIIISIDADSEDKYMKDDSYGKFCEQSDIKITETPLHPAVGDPMAKNKRCAVM